MRLTHYERQNIKKWAQKYDAGAKVYLYGSRVDEARRGGDIDLLVVSEHTQKFKDKIELVLELHDLIGEQKIDLAIRSPEVLKRDVFFRSIFPQAVEL